MKRLSTATLGALLAAGLTAPAFAQAPPPAPADTARHQRQMGLTASPQLDNFFTANRSLPVGVLYQRQLTPAKALRLRLSGLLSYADSANFLDSSPSGIVNGYVEGPSHRRWQVQVFAGYAWQRRLSRRVALDYGLEAGLGYQRLGYSAARKYPYPPAGLSWTTTRAPRRSGRSRRAPSPGSATAPRPACACSPKPPCP
ncbi:hypothetical protein [Hymenobacter saemangeumensis]